MKCTSPGTYSKHPFKKIWASILNEMHLSWEYSKHPFKKIWASILNEMHLSWDLFKTPIQKNLGKHSE